MPSDTLRYALIMLLAGIGIPILAALNSQLGARIGAPVAASVVLFAVALLACAVVLAFSGQAHALALLPAQPNICSQPGCSSPSMCCRSLLSRRALALAMRCSACCSAK